MIVTNEFLNLLREVEGLKLKSYLCPAGIWTIGYGSTGPDVGPGLVWTLDQCEQRMRQDALNFTIAASRLCPGLTPLKTSALADFAYNLGSTRLAGSTLRRKVNAHDTQGAAKEFGKWIRAGGRILPGLVKRRFVEREWFLA